MQNLHRTTNILFLCARSDIGGAQRVMYEIICWFTQHVKTIYIHVACPEAWPFYSRYEKLSSSGFLFLTSLPLRRIRLNNLLRLLRVVRNNNIGLVISHGKGAGLWSRLLRLLTQVKVIHYFHGIHVPMKLTMKSHSYVVIERILMRLTDLHVCVSESERQRAISLRIVNPTRTVVIPNGVDIQYFHPPEGEERLKARSDIGVTAPFVILTVGRLARVKNIPFALRIFACLLRRRQVAQFIIVGGEDDYSQQEAKQKAYELGIYDFVLFAKETLDVLPYYHAADVYIGTSHWEGLPSTILEAQACCLPVVASDVVGNRSAIIDGVTGYLVNAFCEESFVEKLITLAENPVLRSRLGMAGREFVANSFSVEQCATQLLYRVHELVGCVD